MSDPAPILLRPGQDCDALEQWAIEAGVPLNAHLLSDVRGGQPELSEDSPADEAAWAELVAELAGALAGLRPSQFVIPEYHPGGEPEPYAQAAFEMGGYHCELVSEQYLPAGQWPIDDVAIHRQGWTPPDSDTPNWWRWAATAEQAARHLVDGLHQGRRCPDLAAYTWWDGTFPGGGGGGKPLPMPQKRAA